jgi:hypothetical protein
MKISGAYRITLMKQNHRKYCLISDVHIDAQGCGDEKSIPIKDLLKAIFNKTNYKILYLLEYSVGLIPQDNQGFMVELFSQTYKCFMKDIDHTNAKRLPDKENICSSNVLYEAIDIRQSKNGNLFKSWESHSVYDKLVRKIYKNYVRLYKANFDNVKLYKDDNRNQNNEELLSFINGKMLTLFLTVCCYPLINNDSQILLKNELLSFKRNDIENFTKSWHVCTDYVYRIIHAYKPSFLDEELKTTIRSLLGVVAVDLYAISKLETNDNKDINNIVVYAGKDHINNYIDYINLNGGIIVSDNTATRQKRCLNIKNEITTFFNT